MGFFDLMKRRRRPSLEAEQMRGAAEAAAAAAAAEEAAQATERTRPTRRPSTLSAAAGGAAGGDDNEDGDGPVRLRRTSSAPQLLASRFANDWLHSIDATIPLVYPNLAEQLEGQGFSTDSALTELLAEDLEELGVKKAHVRLILRAVKQLRESLELPARRRSLLRIDTKKLRENIARGTMLEETEDEGRDSIADAGADAGTPPPPPQLETYNSCPQLVRKATGRRGSTGGGGSGDDQLRRAALGAGALDSPGAVRRAAQLSPSPRGRILGPPSRVSGPPSRLGSR